MTMKTKRTRKSPCWIGRMVSLWATLALLVPTLSASSPTAIALDSSTTHGSLATASDSFEKAAAKLQGASHGRAADSVSASAPGAAVSSIPESHSFEHQVRRYQTNQKACARFLKDHPTFRHGGSREHSMAPPEANTVLATAGGPSASSSLLAEYHLVCPNDDVLGQQHQAKQREREHRHLHHRKDPERRNVRSLSQAQPSRHLQWSDEGVDICATATEVTFADGQTKVTIAGRNDEVAQTTAGCYSYSSGDHVDTYNVMGTGNAMYATTCSKDESEIETVMDVQALVGFDGCSSSNFECVESSYYEHCATNPGKASAVLWDSTNGTMYHLSVSSFDDRVGGYTMTVGQLVANESANDSCHSAIALNFKDGVASTNGNNGGALADAEEFCRYHDASSSVWYSINGNGNKFIASTCSDRTTFHTSLAVLRSDGNEGCDSSQCIDYSSHGSFCDSGEHPTIEWVSEPGVAYLIQVSSASIGLTGDFELTITEEIPTPFDRCYDAQQKFEEATVGVDCNCEYVTPSKYDGSYAFRLVCIDHCRYCNVNGALCSNKEYESTFLWSGGVEHKNTTIYAEGSAEAISFEVDKNGRCIVRVNGTACSACETQPSCDGAPIVDCSNVHPTLEPIDLCYEDTAAPMKVAVLDPKSIGTDSHNAWWSNALHNLIVGGADVCTVYSSQASCEARKEELEMAADVACSCSLDQSTAGVSMECKTTCGYYCNADESICVDKSYATDFESSGAVRDTHQLFEYTVGREDEFTVSVSTWGSFSFCYVNAFPRDCTCDVLECDDGTTKPSMSCNHEGESDAFNFCAPTVVNDGLFQALSMDGFGSCVDKSPVHDICSNAMPLEANGTLIIDSTQHVQTGEVDVCEENGRNGLWYTIVGDGEMLRVSTDHDVTDISTVVSVRVGDCDSFECVATSEWSHQDIDFFAEKGRKYMIYVSGYSLFASYVERGTFGLMIQPTPAGIIACEEARGKANSNLECFCYEGEDQEVSLLCLTTCGRMCNQDQSACMMLTSVDSFDDDGDRIESIRLYNYTNGRQGLVATIIDHKEATCQGAIALSEFDVRPCSSCALVQCPDGATSAQRLDCSYVMGGDVFDLCGTPTVSRTSLFQVFDDTAFGTCYTEDEVAAAFAETATPSQLPSSTPSWDPSPSPTSSPSWAPSTLPSPSPSNSPSHQPTVSPSVRSSGMPSEIPTMTSESTQSLEAPTASIARSSYSASSRRMPSAAFAVSATAIVLGWVLLL